LAGLEKHNSEKQVSNEEQTDSVQQLVFEKAPHLSKRRITLEGVGFILLGTITVLIFAEPLVEAMTSLSHKISIDAFYISFVLTPIASNASELFNVYFFAAKKTKKNISLVFSSLYGAVCMNNTVSLGLFLGMLFFRDLAWTFSAETLVTLVVVLSVGLKGIWSNTIKLYHAIWVALLYPISIALVVLLRALNWN